MLSPSGLVWENFANFWKVESREKEEKKEEERPTRRWMHLFTFYFFFFTLRIGRHCKILIARGAPKWPSALALKVIGLQDRRREEAHKKNEKAVRRHQTWPSTETKKKRIPWFHDWLIDVFIDLLEKLDEMLRAKGTFFLRLTLCVFFSKEK